MHARIMAGRGPRHHPLLCQVSCERAGRCIHSVTPGDEWRERFIAPFSLSRPLVLLRVALRVSCRMKKKQRKVSEKRVAYYCSQKTQQTTEPLSRTLKIGTPRPCPPHRETRQGGISCAVPAITSRGDVAIRASRTEIAACKLPHKIILSIEITSSYLLLTPAATKC